MGILDFFSREAGQERRRALDSLLSQFIPPTARPQFNLLGELNPVVAMERAGQDAQRIGATQGWERVGATGDMLSNMAGVVAPALAMRGAGRPVAQAVEEGLLGFSTSPQGLALGDFAADESGALRLWHGSPHDFDRFSMDKIGTGEGAQAYGHGLYFAEAEDTAKAYRDALSRGLDDTGQTVRIDGNPIIAPTADQVRAARFGPERAAESLSGQIEAAKRRLATASDADDLGIGVSDRDMVQMEIDALTRRLADVRGLAGRIEMGPAGRLYEVEVAADPADFLDWDKPLSAQPERVRDALASVKERYGLFAGPGTRGQGFYEEASDVISPTMKASDAAASAALREAGIPGIRYLDAGSRGAGDGSRNYVVFDENLITIIRKYGIAGAAAMLGMSQADLAQAMELQQQSQPMGLLNMGAQ